ncbi:MAG: alkene reductase, partial [Halieaceae bacterium]|nr:alkene reductase [Halieaceae bacterium]
MNLDALFSPLKLGAIELPNRIIMAPMTRSRATDDDLVTDLHVNYYRQRASAGLIISEGVHPSAAGKGYNRTPGLFLPEHAEAWSKVTAAVKAEGGQMVAQLMHCGRVGHADNKAPGARFLAPSAIACKEQIFTPNGMQNMPEPEAMTLDEIKEVQAQYVNSALLAMQAGFSGVELHCTSGYLPAQFLSTGTNQRGDNYGGSLANRLRFVLETLDALCVAVGSDRVGLRICPANPFNDLHDDNPKETFSALMQALNQYKLAYLHVIRMNATGLDSLALAREHYEGAVIANDSYKAQEANQTIADGSVDAVSFGRPFIANP